MGKEITIGGERLGAGKKMKAYMHNYERSTHDLSYIWRSTMSAGTLVPFMSKLALPGDTFDIDLACEILTHPTIGPLFGSYKVQLDIFQVPIRLYQAKLHMNALNVGKEMKNVKLPQIVIQANNIDTSKDMDNQQINPSSIFSYLGIRGLGHHQLGVEFKTVGRNFNAIPWLGYWDIYKNYYANKQEEIGAVIHTDLTEQTLNVATLTDDGLTKTLDITAPPTWNDTYRYATPAMKMVFKIGNIKEYTNVGERIIIYVKREGDGVVATYRLNEIFEDISIDMTLGVATAKTLKYPTSMVFARGYEIGLVQLEPLEVGDRETPVRVQTFDLNELDRIREDILKHFSNIAFEIHQLSRPPFKYALSSELFGSNTVYSKEFSQEGLAIKTYNSDLFNNWLNSEWIDGENGVAAVTAINTESGNFTLDEFNLKKKIYNMLTRITLSGGTYDDWLSAVYTHDKERQIENPIYLGGLIKELVFQEVISNAETSIGNDNKPLGTLAGRGRLGSKNKGGKVIAKIDEPSYLIGIISLTPRIDYSQGNQWDVNLKSMDDFHKPALDAIGFQDLVTDQMAYFDTTLTEGGEVIFKSAGKQPAWINYMTDVNVVKGNFASNQMFMVLNRRYEWSDPDNNGIPAIKDLTTYIDPSKFNFIFAETSLSSQNFWAQIKVDITARRKMSSKIIPNL